MLPTDFLPARSEVVTTSRFHCQTLDLRILDLKNTANKFQPLTFCASAGEPRLVRGDADLLQQLMLNLLRNAVEATSRGGQTGGHISIRTELWKDDILVALEDNGTGIDSVILDSLFEPFMSGKPNGIGLGLGICRQIVLSHGGEIEAENIMPHGARFTVRLPRARRQPDDKPVSVAQPIA